MAASTGQHMFENLRKEKSENYGELPEFESCIDEGEALSSLEDLWLSDDEYFVDLDVDCIAENSNFDSVSDSAICTLAQPLSTQSQPTACTSSSATAAASATVQPQPQLAALACTVCGKTYKRATFLAKHREKCTVALPGSSRKRTKVGTASVDQSVTDIQNLKKSLEASELITNVLRDIVDDPVLSLVPNSPGWKKKELARLLLQEQWNDNPWDTCGTAVINALFDAILQGNEQKFSCSGTLNMLSSVAKACMELKTPFFDAIRQSSVAMDEHVANNLLQHMIDLLLPAISKKLLKSKQDQAQCEPTPAADLTQDEKQVLHYVIGYTAKKLRRKFNRCSVSNKAAQLYLDVVNTWTVDPEESTLCSDVQGWTRSLDRGGLLHCSAPFFQFMKVVELNVRAQLNTKTIASYAGENVVPIVVQKVKGSLNLQEAFRMLVGHHLTSEQLCEGLLDEVLVAWVQCKARRVAENYIFELKMKGNAIVSRKGTPAMRKTLDKV